MQIRMVHTGRDRVSLLMPMDDRTVDLMSPFSIQLVRVEPTTRLTVFRTWQTHSIGDGILHDGGERLISTPTATSPSTARLAQHWISHCRHHLIPAPAEAPVRLTARAIAPQLITYWDNDWLPPPTAP